MGKFLLAGNSAGSGSLAVLASVNIPSFVSVNPNTLVVEARGTSVDSQVLVEKTTDGTSFKQLGAATITGKGTIAVPITGVQAIGGVDGTNVAVRLRFVQATPGPISAFLSGEASVDVVSAPAAS